MEINGRSDGGAKGAVGPFSWDWYLERKEWEKQCRAADEGPCWSFPGWPQYISLSLRAIRISLSHNIQIPGLPKTAMEREGGEGTGRADKRRGMKWQRVMGRKKWKFSHSPIQRTIRWNKFCHFWRLNKVLPKCPAIPSPSISVCDEIRL